MQTQSKAPSHTTNPITSLHPSQSPNKSPRTKKHAETPPTYPFPAYSIVKDLMSGGPNSTVWRTKRGAGSTPSQPRLSTLGHNCRGAAKLAALLGFCWIRENCADMLCAHGGIDD
jgi:hypothetical protein